MVDEADSSVKAGGGKEAWLGDRRDQLEGLGIDKLEVIDREALWAVAEEVVACRIEVDLGVLLSASAEITRSEEGTADARRISSLVGLKARVSWGESEPVCCPNGGVADHWDGEIEVPDHAVDESKLLEVFLAKDREIWLEDIEELENDGEDAIKMPRSACSAEVPRQEAFLNDDGVVALVAELTSALRVII